MFKIILSVLSFNFIFNAQAFTKATAISCDAIYQTVVDDKLVSEKAPLVLDFEDVRTIRLIADIGEYHFFVQGDKITNDYLMIISLGPDYTSGATAALNWDQKNQLRMTRVDGNDVYKIQCGQ